MIQRVLEGLGQSGAAGATPGGPLWVPDDATELAQSHDLRALIRETIDETAARGDVVIVAHAAAFALAGRDDLLRVLVTAPAEIRMRRLAEARGGDAAQAAKELERSDEARAAYLKTFYGVEREFPTDYDLVLNTEILEPEAAADIVARAAGAYGSSVRDDRERSTETSAPSPQVALTQHDDPQRVEAVRESGDRAGHAERRDRSRAVHGPHERARPRRSRLGPAGTSEGDTRMPVPRNVSSRLEPLRSLAT